MYFHFTAAITLGYFEKGFTMFYYKKIGMTYYIWTGWKKMLALASLQKKGSESTRERPSAWKYGHFGWHSKPIVAALRQGQDVVHHEGSICIASCYIELQKINPTGIPWWFSWSEVKIHIEIKWRLSFPNCPQVFQTKRDPKAEKSKFQLAPWSQYTNGW